MGIKEKAKQIKDKNGNNKITNKELLFYIIGRLDDLEKRQAEVTKLRTQVRILYILMPVMATFFIYILQ